MNNYVLGSPPGQTFADGISNSVTYSFVPADAANQQGDEGFPFGTSFLNALGISRTTIANRQYQFLKNYIHVKWRADQRPEYFTEIPFKNDLAVQVPSMTYPSLSNLVTNSEGFLLFNHRSEMNPLTAQIVLTTIRGAQYIQ